MIGTVLTPQAPTHSTGSSWAVTAAFTAVVPLESKIIAAPTLILNSPKYTIDSVISMPIKSAAVAVMSTTTIINTIGAAVTCAGTCPPSSAGSSASNDVFSDGVLKSANCYQVKGEKGDATKNKPKVRPVYYTNKGLERYSRTDLKTVGVPFCLVAAVDTSNMF
jgi:hypothetical protein